MRVKCFVVYVLMLFMGRVWTFSGTTHSLGGCILSISTKQKKKNNNNNKLKKKEEALGYVQRSLS